MSTAATVLWVGGAPGAGKTTVSGLLSRRHDLPLHSVDLWTWDHRERLRLDDPAPDATPRERVAAFWREADARMPLVLDDVAARGCGDVPVLVEGPQLRPDDPGAPPPGRAVWLLPDAGTSRDARLGRSTAAGRGVDDVDLEGLLERDALLAEEISDPRSGRAGRWRGWPSRPTGRLSTER